MTRKNTVGGRRWVEKTRSKPAHWEFYQEDVPFTAAEEGARTAEELTWDTVIRPAELTKQTRMAELNAKVDDGSADLSEVLELMRLQKEG